MSKIQFSGFRTPYDEEQAYQRHLTYLKTKQRTSLDLQKQGLNNELGLNQVMPMPKTSGEILEDEQEVNKIVQSYLVSFFTDNPNLLKRFNETDAQYQNRKYPSRYVFNNLSQDDKRVILEQYPAIKTQLSEVAILTPEYFLNFIKNYKEALQRSGGVKGFTSGFDDELKGILSDLPQKDDIENLKNMIVDIQDEMINMKDNDEELKELIDLTIEKLFRMETFMPTISQIMELQTALELRIDESDQSIIQALIEDFERLPSRKEFTDLGTFIFQAIDENPSIEDLKKMLNNVLTNIGGYDEILMNIQEEMNSIKRKVSLTENTLGDLATKTNIRLKDGLVEKIYLQMANEYLDIVNKQNPSDKPKVLRNLTKQERSDLQNAALASATKISQESNDETLFNTFNQGEQIPIAYSEMAYQRQPMGKEMATAEPIGEESGKGMIANRIKNKIQPKFITKAKMIGKGVSFKETPKYIEFGKYCLSIPDLNNEILRVKYQKTMVDVPNFKKNISINFVDFIENFIDTQKINERQLEKLNKEEQKLFKRLITKSGLDVKYKVKDYKDENDIKEEDRFNLVKGQYMAGNDNPRVKEELKKFIIKFMMEGKINKKEGQDILFQLSM